MNPRDPGVTVLDCRRCGGQILLQADQALYLEHAIEKHLGISDRPVPGAYRP